MSEDWKPILDLGRSEQNHNWEFVKLIILVILVFIIITILMISDSCEIPYVQLLVQLDLLLNGDVWGKILGNGSSVALIQWPYFKKSFFVVQQNTPLHFICYLKNSGTRSNLNI